MLCDWVLALLRGYSAAHKGLTGMQVGLLRIVRMFVVRAEWTKLIGWHVSVWSSQPSRHAPKSAPDIAAPASVIRSCVVKVWRWLGHRPAQNVDAPQASSALRKEEAVEAGRQLCALLRLLTNLTQRDLLDFGSSPDGPRVDVAQVDQCWNLHSSKVAPTSDVTSCCDLWQLSLPGAARP